MFDQLPETFRAYKLNADVRTLLQLRQAMDKGLVKTVGDLYYVLKGLVTTSPTDIGPFSKAFYAHFLSIDMVPGESLEDAVVRSGTFKEWKDKLDDDEKLDIPDVDLVNQFLDEVHTTSYDIKNFLSGQDILDKRHPDLEDKEGAIDNAPADRNNILDRMADYRDVPLEDLLKRMREVAKRQKTRHEGGEYWIGSGGVSPYGNGGAAAGGVRVGGSGGGKMARAAINNRDFYPVDAKAPLKDDNIDAALAALKGIEEGSSEIILDVPLTIKEGLKQGGIFLPIEKEKRQQRIQVILMIDNGGWSMSPYIRTVQKLFAKMKTRFAHDLRTYYFHNTIYGGLYSDAARTKFVDLDMVNLQDKNYTVFVIGDADMAPYELHRNSIRDWQKLSKHFNRMAWLNPMTENEWYGSMTCSVVSQIFPMFELTPAGIEAAILEMNRKRSFNDQ